MSMNSLQRLNERKTSLLNSPLDYTIGLKTSANLITPNIIRVCKRHKVPVIWVDLDEADGIERHSLGMDKRIIV